MHDAQVFSALNASQDGHCLARRLRFRPLRELDGFDDSLSDVVLGCYERADDREDLLSHLRYCVRELQSAVNAVRQLEESHVPSV
jgi:hypothetical protein